MNETAISERLTAAQHRLEQARREAGAAVLDGRKFDSQPMADLEREIDALFEAGQLNLARTREAEAAARRKQRAAIVKELRATEKTRLEAVAAMEQAARDLLAAMNQAVGLSDDVARLFKQAGSVVPLDLTGPGLHTRLGERLAAILMNNKAHPRQLGSYLKWTPSGRFTASDDWQSGEAALIAPTIDKLAKDI